MAILALLAATARAEPRRNDLVSCAIRTTNSGRVDAGMGLLGGLAHEELRVHASDSVALAVRLRFDRSAVQVVEGEVGWSVGRGKMLFPWDAIGRTDLYVRAGGGANDVAGQWRGDGFIGLAWRFYPVSRLAIDLGVRERWAAHEIDIALRGTSVAGVQHAWSTELGFTIALASRERRVCNCR